MSTTQKPINPLFTRQALVALLLPLIAEQALSVTIGLADTLMVSSVGEAAVSGVSLVDSFNTLMIQVMSALATGGAVVTSQYIGHREPKNAKAAAGCVRLPMCCASPSYVPPCCSSSTAASTWCWVPCWHWCWMPCSTAPLSAANSRRSGTLK